ncbi:hypothetical protein H2200_003859 [Cladophialophora chaetospira]|uniref:DUF6594 domain-containing protein n=1 Tax=Cladophialophora chaetospira TaxID=386627 RepID=A0AA39CL51_9EURO|nr:hypothetical protein H2200_003859 [Cladophialophora chaetospira]
MATIIDPVELPTGRRSYYNVSTPIDIHDPNWIPVLDGSSYKPQLSPTEKEVFNPQPMATFSLFPSQSTSPKNSPKPRSGFSHNYSKSAMAPESVTSDSDSRSQSPQDSIEPLPSIPSSFQSSHDAAKGHNRQTTSTTTASNEEKISVGTEAQGDTGGAPSTEDTENASVVDDRASSRQSQPMEQIVESMVSPSIRSSITSTKKSMVLPPTSKYNRKPVGSISARSALAPSLPQTPQDSPRLGPSALASPAMIPPPSPVMIPPPPPEPVASPKLPPFELAQHPDSSSRLHAAKSTASERRQRALHSHPSNISLRSRRNSDSDEAENIPRPPSVRSKARKSTDSRATTPRSTIYDMPTPAPTTPLPQLPPEAHIQSRRPSTRSQHKTTPPPTEEPLPPPTPSFRAFDHARVASFMTEKNTIVLRRFDDVHARLLLSLQDEISQLELELSALENPTSSGSASEKILAKTRILRELRKVVAEYDHLFNTWSKMQTNKVSDSTTRDLKQWLSTPEPGAEPGLGNSTQQNLQWLQNTKDLSTIELGDDDTAPSIRKEKPPSEVDGPKRGGSGGFMAFLNCAGKRK